VITVWDIVFSGLSEDLVLTDIDLLTHLRKWNYCGSQTILWACQIKL